MYCKNINKIVDTERAKGYDIGTGSVQPNYLERR